MRSPHLCGFDGVASAGHVRASRATSRTAWRLPDWARRQPQDLPLRAVAPPGATAMMTADAPRHGRVQVDACEVRACESSRWPGSRTCRPLARRGPAPALPARRSRAGWPGCRARPATAPSPSSSPCSVPLPSPRIGSSSTSPARRPRPPWRGRRLAPRSPATLRWRSPSTTSSHSPCGTWRTASGPSAETRPSASGRCSRPSCRRGPPARTSRPARRCSSSASSRRKQTRGCSTSRAHRRPPSTPSWLGAARGSTSAPAAVRAETPWRPRPAPAAGVRLTGARRVRTSRR